MVKVCDQFKTIGMIRDLTMVKVCCLIRPAGKIQDLAMVMVCHLFRPVRKIQDLAMATVCPQFRPFRKIRGQVMARVCDRFRPAGMTQLQLRVILLEACCQPNRALLDVVRPQNLGFAHVLLIAVQSCEAATAHVSPCQSICL